MKKLLFDLFSAQPSGGSKFHGGGEYIKSIFKELSNNYLDKIHLVVFYDSTKFIDEWIREQIEIHKISTYNIKEREEIKGIFEKEKIDVFFSGLPEHYNSEWFPQGIKKVGTIHGLRKIEKPYDLCELKYMEGPQKLRSTIRYLKNVMLSNHIKKKLITEQRRTITFLDYVMTDSIHSFYALKYFFPEIEGKVGVFYPPEKTVSVEVEDLNRVINDKYLLLIGGNRWLKNTYRGLLAIDSLYERGFLQKVKTVVVGNVSTTIKKELINAEEYIWLDYVSANELEALYKYCEVFVYPSLNEGFGYPPIEAMKYGKTCVVSAVCSLPEICGNAVYYTNPYDIDEIANRIVQGIDNKIPFDQIDKQRRYINQKQKKGIQNICSLLVLDDTCI